MKAMKCCGMGNSGTVYLSAAQKSRSGFSLSERFGDPPAGVRLWPLVADVVADGID